MTDEEVFQAALDADIENHAMRQVFADWLEEQGDPRAEAYRWLGGNQKHPFDWPAHLDANGDIGGATPRTFDWCGPDYSPPSDVESPKLPLELYTLLLNGSRGTNGDYFEYPTRQAAEAAFCVAFLRWKRGEFVLNGTTYRCDRTLADLLGWLVGREGRRLAFYYGDPETGAVEPEPERGYVGRSTGASKIPLLIHNRRSMGGGPLGEHRVMMVRLSRDPYTLLWAHPNAYKGDAGRPAVTLPESAELAAG